MATPEDLRPVRELERVLEPGGALGDQLPTLSHLERLERATEGLSDLLEDLPTPDYLEEIQNGLRAVVAQLGRWRKALEGMPTLVRWSGRSFVRSFGSLGSGTRPPIVHEKHEGFADPFQRASAWNVDIPMLRRQL